MFITGFGAPIAMPSTEVDFPLDKTIRVRIKTMMFTMSASRASMAACHKEDTISLSHLRMSSVVIWFPRLGVSVSLPAPVLYHSGNFLLILVSKAVIIKAAVVITLLDA